QRCHESLAFVHASYEVQLRQTTMSNLAVLQGLRKYPDHLSAAREGSVGSRAHQPTGGSTINQSPTATRNPQPQRFRFSNMLWICPHARPTKYTDSSCACRPSVS